MIRVSRNQVCPVCGLPCVRITLHTGVKFIMPDWAEAYGLKWYTVVKAKHTSYVKCWVGHHVHWLHRGIMMPDDGLVVHHIDGNGLNNCTCNLECTTQRNNCATNNKINPPKTNTGYPGITELPDQRYLVTCNGMSIKATSFMEAADWRSQLLLHPERITEFRRITRTRQNRSGKLNRVNKNRVRVAEGLICKGATISQVARSIHVKRDTIYRWLERGFIHAPSRT